MDEQVTYIDTAEAMAEKTAKVFSDTQYDDSTASTGAFGKLDEIKTKVDSISENVGELMDRYKELEGMYDQFTNFNEAMDQNIYRFELVIGNINQQYTELKTAIEERVNEQVKADQELNQDIESNTNEITNGESGDTTGGSGGGGTTPTDGASTPTGGTTPTDGASTPTGGTTPTGGETSGTTPAAGEQTESKDISASDTVMEGTMADTTGLPVTSEGNITDNKLPGTPPNDTNKTTDTTTPTDGTTSTTPADTSNKKSAADIADEIIKGNYGNGAERQKKIEEQGYNYREVQDIVNAKLKGTYNGSTSTSAGTTTGTGTASGTTGSTNTSSGSTYVNSDGEVFKSGGSTSSSGSSTSSSSSSNGAVTEDHRVYYNTNSGTNSGTKADEPKVSPTFQNEPSTSGTGAKSSSSNGQPTTNYDDRGYPSSYSGKTTGLENNVSSNTAVASNKNQTTVGNNGTWSATYNTGLMNEPGSVNMNSVPPTLPGSSTHVADSGITHGGSTGTFDVLTPNYGKTVVSNNGTWSATYNTGLMNEPSSVANISNNYGGTALHTASSGQTHGGGVGSFGTSSSTDVASTGSGSSGHF